MAKISFVKNFTPIEIQPGDNLMESLLNAQIPVASSCHGDGVCTKCRMKIIKGKENLSPETDFEIRLKKQQEVQKDLRISCQTKVLGDITVDTDYW